MRNLSFKGLKCDKKYLIAVIIASICAIISGIVLYKLANVSIYFCNYAEDYIFFIFTFNNGQLIISHILSEIFYLYLFFLIGYLTRFKYLTLIFVFIRVTYFTIYTAILIELNALGGITVAVLVFIPSSLISLLFCYVLTESCGVLNKKIVFFAPAILAAINTIIFLLLINVVFRVVIVIV